MKNISKKELVKRLMKLQAKRRKAAESLVDQYEYDRKTRRYRP